MKCLFGIRPREQKEIEKLFKKLKKPLDNWEVHDLLDYRDKSSKGNISLYLTHSPKLFKLVSERKINGRMRKTYEYLGD